MLCDVRRNRGLGGSLLRYQLTLTQKPCLVGTWATAAWAIPFYERHGFRLVSPDEKDRLLPLYWGVPAKGSDPLDGADLSDRSDSAGTSDASGNPAAVRT